MAGYVFFAAIGSFLALDQYARSFAQSIQAQTHR